MNKRVLIILPYTPSKKGKRPNKADAMYSTIDSILSGNYEVVLFSSGWEEEHPYKSITKKYTISESIKIVFFKILRRLSVVGNEKVSKTIRESQISAIASFHDRNPIDVVIAYGTSSSTIKLAYQLFKKVEIPYVVREHRTFYQRIFNKKSDIPGEELNALEEAAELLAVSPQLISQMKRIGIKRDIKCLPNSIPNKFFTSPDFSAPFKDWVNGRFVFAGWTNWRSFKRLDLLIDAFSIVHSRFDNVCLIVAGPIQDLAAIKEKISKLSLSDSILLYGKSSREEIHQLAHLCDCCVISSDYETFGLPCLEANAAGKPVVATRCGGPESIIVNEKLGKVVEKGDHKNLADAMLNVYMNYQNYDSDYIKKHTYDVFSEDAVQKKWANVLDNV